MKIIKMILALVMAFSLLTPLQLPVEAAGTNMSNATKINVNSTVNGVIYMDTWITTCDYYKIYLSKSGTLVFDFESMAEYFDMYLYDYVGNKIYYNSTSYYDHVKGVNEGSYKFRLSAGTYYIAIGGGRPNGYVGSYSFSTYFVNSNETITEYYDNDNDTIKSANKISINKQYNGHIGIEDVKDFYKFYLNESGKVYLSSSMYFNRSAIYLYDEDGDLIWQDNDKYWNENTKKCIEDYSLYLNAGTYYLTFMRNPEDMWLKSTDNYGAYSFKLNYKSTNEKIKEYTGGSNNSYNNASKISLKPQYTTFNGQISINDDCDFYKFYAPKESILGIEIETTFDDTNFYVYDSNGEELYSQTGVYVDGNTKVASVACYGTIEKGTYYFCITGGYCGSYKVKTTLTCPFYDIWDSRYDWYFNTVNEAYYKGLVSGVSEGYFSPNTNMTRGMVANVLYRMAGSPNVSYKKKFSDVKAGLWYSNAITWCSNKGVVSGYSNGKFGPDDYITREQMAAMCNNYAKYRVGRKPSATTSITKFKDDHKVTSYMKEAMKWAVASGIISGTKDGYLKPTAKATRAECTKMLLQLSKIVK